MNKKFVVENDKTRYMVNNASRSLLVQGAIKLLAATQAVLNAKEHADIYLATGQGMIYLGSV